MHINERLKTTNYHHEVDRLTVMYPCCCRAEWTQPGTCAGSNNEPLEFDSLHLPFRLTVRRCCRENTEKTPENKHQQAQPERHTCSSII